MSNHTLVMDYCPDLLHGFHQARIAVRVHDSEQIIQAVEDVTRHNTLAAVIVELETALIELTLLPEWRDIPIAFHLPAMGEFHQIAGKVEALRSMNARLYFSTDSTENHTACRILSSLGIATGLSFTNADPDWDSLCDLMAYSLYGKVRHAPIEPFDYLITNYDPKKRNSWDKVWFDNPESTLHISSDGKIAFTRRELLAGNFISDQLGDIHGIAENPLYQERQEAWRELFLKDDGCAFCPAWRVCLGRFDGVCADRASGCQKFFMELMEAAEERLKMQGNMRKLWQP